MVAPTKIIAGLGLSLDIDILEAPGATGDYRTQLTSKATAIAKALSAPLQSSPNVFVPGEDGNKPGRSDGYDFGFLHIKVNSFIIYHHLCLFCLWLSDQFPMILASTYFSDLLCLIQIKIWAGAKSQTIYVGL